jgi:hypothetical protein
MDKDPELLNLYGDNSSSNNDESIVLEGELTNPISAESRPTFDTLDEPIKDTLLRDIRAVSQKFKHVIYPVETKSLLADWDLWGPLILCTFMAFLLENSQDEDGGPAFAEFFALTWIGSLVVTFNIKLLGGHISFFQSACVIGYCLFPLASSLAVSKALLMTVSDQNMVVFIMRSVVVFVSFIWASYAAMQFLGDCQPAKRKALAAYPLFLFYFVIAWMILSDTD